MPEQGLSITLILSEIILIETIFIIAISVYFFLKSKKKSKKLKVFLESFLDDEKNRLSVLSETLKKPDFLDDEKYNTALQAIINEENLFYKHLVNIFYINNVKQMESLAAEIQKITRPCANLLAKSERLDIDEIDDIPEIDMDMDDAFDEILSDDDNTETDIDNDPAFDLSEPAEITTELPTEEPVKTTTEKSEIAEIPSNLLDNVSSTSTDETGPDNMSEKNNVDTDTDLTKNELEK